MWIECLGVPPHGCTCENFKKIGVCDSFGPEHRDGFGFSSARVFIVYFLLFKVGSLCLLMELI